MFREALRPLLRSGVGAAALITLLIPEAFAGRSVTVAWDPNPEPDIAHYHVIYGTASREYSFRQTVNTETSALITDLQEGVTYYFAVTAENVHGLESDPSIELSHLVPVTPVNLPPLAVGDQFAAIEDTVLTITAGQLLANDSDPNAGDVISFVAAGPVTAAGGTVAMNGGNLVLTPRQDHFGSDTFAYVIRDGGGLNATGLVTVAVAAVNDRPTISAFSNRSINEDGTTGPISFSINDVDHSVGSLTVSGSSSNPTLVSAANIVFGGSGSNRSVTVTPAPDRSGTTTISITVSDGLLNATASFGLTVQPVNDAPVVLAGSDKSVSLSSPLALSGSVTDDGLPNPPGIWSANWSRISGPGEVVFSSSTTPATSASFSQAGNYVLRLTATDGLLTSVDDLAVTVLGDVDQTGPVVSGIEITSADARTVNLGWTTDEPATGQLEYGLTSSADQLTIVVGGLAVAHEATVSGLSPGTRYYARVRATDESGNEALSELVTFVTPELAILRWPAEEGGLTSPMTVGSDPMALDGGFVVSASVGQGTAGYPVSVGVASTYQLWSRVQTGTAGVGSLELALNGANVGVFGVSDAGWQPGWRWVKLAFRDNAFGEPALPTSFPLETDVQSLVIRTLEAPVMLDDMILSNDPDWVPGIDGTAPFLMATPAGNDRIELEWVDAVTNEDGFVIEWSLDGVNFLELDSTPAGMTRYAHGGLAPGTLFHYRVYAFNQTDRTEYSNIAAGLTPPVVLPPAAPGNLKGTRVGKADVRLTWADRSPDEAGFMIQRSSDGQTYETVQTLEFNITSTSDSPPGLRGRRSYSYRVVAFNAGGFSEPSNVVFVGDK